ncbi:hypothetical protein B0H13DRAFT_1857493 [Mycena leptocephala]|nr:hypothetical protein B0H13DRAFT_1857493 [Mycena leptocephala]
MNPWFLKHKSESENSTSSIVCTNLIYIKPLREAAASGATSSPSHHPFNQPLILIHAAPHVRLAPIAAAPVRRAPMACTHTFPAFQVGLRLTPAPAPPSLQRSCGVVGSKNYADPVTSVPRGGGHVVTLAAQDLLDSDDEIMMDMDVDADADVNVDLTLVRSDGEEENEQQGGDEEQDEDITRKLRERDNLTAQRTWRLGGGKSLLYNLKMS